LKTSELCGFLLDTIDVSHGWRISQPKLQSQGASIKQKNGNLLGVFNVYINKKRKMIKGEQK